jgi:predicted transcriptional regulator
MVRRNFMLNEDLDRSLDEAAALLDQKKSSIVSKALSQYLDRLDLELARERATEYEARPDSSLSAEELRRRLEL